MWRQVCAMTLMFTVLCAVDHNREDRQPRSADPFWISGRYGRSLSSPADLTERNHRVLRHAEEDADQQKDNRFFLTNRYGKRARTFRDRSANQLQERFGERWKKQFVCDCMPREHYKRNVYRGSA